MLCYVMLCYVMLVMILEEKHGQKINYFINMSNTMIFGCYLENMQIMSLRACQHYLLDSAY